MSSATDSGMVKTMGVVMGALALLAVIIVIAARSLSGSADDPNDPVLRQALMNRIGPVGGVRTSVDELPSAAADVVAVADVAAAPRSAEELYNGVCAACHDTGVAGAPMKGDEAAWPERLAKGVDDLVASAINGIGTMPARGGSTYTDEEMRRVVQYTAGVEVDEPAGAADDAAAEGDEAESADEPAGEADEQSEAAAEQDDDTAAADPADTGDVAEEATQETPEEASEAVAADESAASQTAEAETIAAVAVVGQEPEGLSDHVRSSVDTLCVACHLAGVGGAPKMGDQAAWQERADKGMDALVASVINGVGAMPPRGATTLTDEEIPFAIQYIMSK